MTETIEVLNNLLAATFSYSNERVAEVIDIHQSHSTNSFYIIAKTADDEIKQISFSDHYSHTHFESLSDLSMYDEDYDAYEELQQALGDISNAEFRDYTFDENTTVDYFGVDNASQYDIDPETLIGDLSFDRAFISDSYTIVKAELLNDKRVLKITYDNNDTESYVNYTPSSYTKQDCVLANYLASDRKKEYSDWDISSFEEYSENFDDEIAPEATEDGIIEFMQDDYSISEYFIEDNYVYFKLN